MARQQDQAPPRHASANQPPIQRVNLVTERFALKGLRAQDATPALAAWYQDPRVVEPLNLPVGSFSLETIARDFAAADGLRQFSIGIFPREPTDGGPGAMIGYYTLYRDARHRTAIFNVVIGDVAWWGRGVVLETRAALLTHFFAERGIEKAIGLPHARNFPAVFNYMKQGWRCEGILRGHSLAHDGSRRLDQLHFAMLKEDWPQAATGEASDMANGGR